MNSRRCRIRTYLPRPYGTLKEASAQLVANCGGLNRAAERCRVRPSTLAAATDPARDQEFLAADVVLALELASNTRPITDYFASRHNCIVMEIGPTEDAPWSKTVSHTLRAVGTLVSLLGEGEPGSGPDAASASDALRSCDDALMALMAVRRRLVRVSGAEQFETGAEA